MEKKSPILPAILAILALFGCVADTGKISAETSDKKYSKDRIMTVLSFDAIPAIKDPEFIPANKAKLKDDAPVIGVSFNGESHAYSIYLLNGHEIVNDEVGGLKIATTW